jgi:hypothetical protein
MLDWQTEEDQTGEEHPPQETAVSPWPRRLSWLLLILLLGGGIWYAVGFEKEQGQAETVVLEAEQGKAETTTQEAEADVRQTHALLRQAILDRYFTPFDRDIIQFNPLISGRDENWARTQERLMTERKLLRHFHWGATHDPYFFDEDQVKEVVFGPDLLTAEVTAVEPYRFWSSVDRQVKIAYLQQSSVYYFGSDPWLFRPPPPDRWLYAPPGPEFWGQPVKIIGENLHVTYPERDREVVEQLFPDLNDLIGNTCRLPGLEPCAPLQVEFGTDSALIGLTLIDNLRRAPGEPIELPTPTLLGVPQDAAGYEFLWLAYGRLLSSAIIAQQTDFICCPINQLYLILLHYHLAQLNLLNWPFSSESAYGQIGFALPRPALFNDLWRSHRIFAIVPQIDVLQRSVDLTRIYVEPNMDLPYDQRIEAERAPAYALIDYLVTEQGELPANLQRLLAQHDNLIDWYREAANTPFMSEQELQFRLMDYIYGQNIFASQPFDPLTITCTPDSPAIRLSYDPATRTWQEQPLPSLPAALIESGWSQPIFRQVYPTAYPDVTLLQTADDTFYLATADLLRPVIFEGDLPGNPGTLQITSAPHAQLFNLTWERLDQNQRTTSHYQLDAAACDDRQCPAQPLPGQVYWSPNGRNTLIGVSNGQDETPGLYLGDARANIKAYLAGHYSQLPPVWLDDEHFAYGILTAEESVQLTIYTLDNSRLIATAGEPPTRQLLTIDPQDLNNLLPEEWDPLPLVQPTALITNQADPGHLFIQAGRAQPDNHEIDEQYYLFWIGLTADYAQINNAALLRHAFDPIGLQTGPQGSRFLIYTIRAQLQDLNAIYEDELDYYFEIYENYSDYYTPIYQSGVHIQPQLSANDDWQAWAYPFGLLLTRSLRFDAVYFAPYDLTNCIDMRW